MHQEHTSFRIAHFSDLHFGTVSYNPLQIFSKRLLGNVNLLISRQWNHFPDRVRTLIEFFKKQHVGHVVIAGDVSTTSLDAEFSIAKELVDRFKENGIEIFCIPGNHDCYTGGAERSRRFYNYFPKHFGNDCFNFLDHRVSHKHLFGKWWLVGLDQAIATSHFSSQGRFDEECEKFLCEALSSIPSDHHILLTGHFPLFNNDPPRKSLIGANRLLDLIKRFPNIRFYLHGHSHRHSIVDLRSSQLPIILDSGSVSHHREGTWNLLDLNEERVHLSSFKYAHRETSPDRWKIFKEHSFFLTES